MLMSCREKIIGLMGSGTKLDKEVCAKLFEIADSDNPTIDKIQIFSDRVGIAFSSVSRFCSRLGYPSFKHFVVEFNSDPTTKNDQKDGTAVLSHYQTFAKSEAEKIKGRIFILSSRRGKALAKMTSERLNDGKIDNRLFKESQDNLKEFIESSQGNTLFLISVSGYSKIFSDAIHYIANLSKPPHIIIFTCNGWLKIFEKYDYISISEVMSKNMPSDSWSDYNICIIDLAICIINVINFLFKNNQHSSKAI